MIEISFEYVNAPGALNERIHAALADKFVELAQVLYEKVEANVSGKILQQKTGALAANIAAGTRIDTASNPMTAFIGPANAGQKEKTLELGGRAEYAFYPTKADVLHWFTKDGESVYRAYVLHHPASKAFHYLQEAADEMSPLMTEGFREAIDRVLRGGI